MAINHLNSSCPHVPEYTRARLLALKAKKSFVLGGGKQYWASTAEIVGVFESEAEECLLFSSNNDEELESSGDGKPATITASTTTSNSTSA